MTDERTRDLLDHETLAVYDAEARTYAERKTPLAEDRTRALVAAAVAGPVLDLGCGAGSHLGLLGPTAIGLDPAGGMLVEARGAHPTATLVRAEAGRLPVRPLSLGAAWAHKSLQHVAAPHLPLVLADLHRSLAVGAPLDLTVFAGEGVQVSDDDLPGRRFTLWEPDALAAPVEGAGFVDPVVALEGGGSDGTTWARLTVRATRGRTLPDTVGPGMRLLVSGLNPSLHAADAGVGYIGPGNRFWPAAAAAGLIPDGADRDPWRLLTNARIGMTDLVKRATPRAAELTTAEFRHGLARLDRLCSLLEPETVLVVGLAGWRAAVDRKATPGWQQRRLGPSPVYVMPSTSGLNAGTSLADLVAHLRTAADGPGAT